MMSLSCDRQARAVISHCDRQARAVISHCDRQARACRSTAVENSCLRLAAIDLKNILIPPLSYTSAHIL